MNAPHAPHTIDPTAPGLRFVQADVGYGEQTVVRDVDLELCQGEFLGVIGPNGAGKSTLLKAVTGSANVQSGRIAVNGVDRDEFDALLLARRVGVVPQTLLTPLAFTAREFTLMGRHAHLGRMALPQPADEAVVDRVMELTDTARLGEERVDTLSGGDLQRLTLAQALAQEPDVLLLDEATSHLDLNHCLQILDLVRTLADGGMAVLGVFHDLDLAARYSDRIAVVSSGAIHTIGTPQEVLTPQLLREVFAVRAVVGTDVVTGSVSVTPVVREQASAAPRDETVFVLGGSGVAAPLLRQLTLAGYTVTVCALNRGDVDQAVAETLGLQHVDLPPFGEPGIEHVEQVRALAAQADVRIVCDMPFGRGNLSNLAAVAAAAGPTVLIGELSEERDFTGGEALGMLETLARDGARSATDIEGALSVIAELFD